ncbi:Mbov_0397 family ICE element conjugal transfer ATPase [Mesomycoplasma molare]|uniref:Type IV secretion system DNA-binding domain-containing protein n=1 Tax=Mesomycoplasma molare TaxID=171288 RepID=A0ABY5TTC1_9BACT|nr:type IV secretion system DNA-binding domain-containing protein [Mesomycoplasma molare]UWD33920.1 type IV secretion system DNA-binding domain-containing protein [Mesomycoplasma molare]
MLQPKNIKKNKILIAKNFFLSDLIYIFISLIISFLISWTVIPDSVQYKKIISFSIFLVLILLISPTLLFLPSHNARIWIILIRVFKYWIENKKFSTNSKRSNVNFFINIKEVDENGNIQFKNVISKGYKYSKIIKFDGYNIWTKNVEEKREFLEKMILFFNSREERITFVKIQKKYNFKEKIEVLNKKNSFLNDKEKQYIDESKKEIEYLQNHEYKDEYFLVIYSKSIEKLEQEVLLISDFFEKVEINFDILDKTDVELFTKSFYLLNQENSNSLDQLTFKNSYFKWNNMFAKINTISDMPLNLNVGWAETFFSSSKSWILWDIDPINTKEYEKIVDSANNKILTNIAFNKKSEFRNKNDIKNMEAIDELAYLLNIENQKLFNSSMLFLNFNRDLKLLKKDINTELQDALKKEKTKINKLKFRQLEAFKSFSLFNDNILNESIEIVSRNLAYSWPFCFEKNVDKNSFYLGKNKKQFFILDIWKRNSFHTNSNCIFFGTSGRGKTTAIKKLILDSYLKKDSSVIIVDPQREYQNFKNIFDISWIDISNRNISINPLQIIEKIDFNNEKNIDQKISSQISFFINWIKILSFSWSEEKEIILMKSIKNLYWNNIEKIKKNDFPIISDLIKELENTNLKKYEKEVYEKEKIKIIEWLKINFENNGIFSWNYNQRTTMNLSHDFIVIDTKTLIENTTKENVNAFFYLILNLIQSKVNQNFYQKKKKSILVFDEVHKFIDKKNMQTLDFIFDSTKTIRKYDGSIILSTQNPSDFSLNIDTNNKTHGILKNIQYKFLFNLPGDDIKIVNSIFNPFEDNKNFNLISEFDSSFLTNAGKGECLLISANKKKMYFKVNYNNFEQEYLFNK